MGSRLRKYLQRVWDEAAENNRRNIIALLEKGIGTLLDCGCDDGSFTERAAAACGAAVALGVEIDPGSAAAARKRGIEVMVADLNQGIPLEDGSVEAVISNQVIEHLHATDLFLSEVTRVLVKGGLLVVSTENLAGWNNIASLALGWQPFSLTNISENGLGIGNPLALHRGCGDAYPPGWQHMRVFAPRGLAELLASHGFAVEKALGAGYFPLVGRAAALMSAVDVRHSAFITMKALRR